MHKFNRSTNEDERKKKNSIKILDSSITLNASNCRPHKTNERPTIDSRLKNKTKNYWKNGKIETGRCICIRINRFDRIHATAAVAVVFIISQKIGDISFNWIRWVRERVEWIVWNIFPILDKKIFNRLIKWKWHWTKHCTQNEKRNEMVSKLRQTTISSGTKTKLRQSLFISAEKPK